MILVAYLFLLELTQEPHKQNPKPSDLSYDQRDHKCDNHALLAPRRGCAARKTSIDDPIVLASTAWLRFRATTERKVLACS